MKKVRQGWKPMSLVYMTYVPRLHDLSCVSQSETQFDWKMNCVTFKSGWMLLRWSHSALNLRLFFRLSVLLCLRQSMAAESETILLPQQLQKDGHHFLLTIHLLDTYVVSANTPITLFTHCATLIQLRERETGAREEISHTFVIYILNIFKNNLYLSIYSFHHPHISC